MIEKIVVLSSALYFWFLWIWVKLIALHHPLTLKKTDQKIKPRVSFIRGGRSARTDYEFLKLYVLSMEVELKNPKEFCYVYGRHRALDDVMQEIKTSGETLLVCNIPLGLVANILTSAQANKTAKEHNLYSLSCRSLEEKRMAVKAHVCTVICNRCVTVFKPVKKKSKNY